MGTNPPPFALDDDERDLFCEEAEEQIAMLEAAILRLERERDDTLVGEALRSAHTLKGSAAAIGHGAMARLAHAFEGALAVLGREQPPAPSVTDALLHALDGLRDMVDRVAAGADAGDAVWLDAELARLGGIGGGEMPEPALLRHTEASPEREERRTIQVEVERLDALVDLAGRLAAGCARLDQFAPGPGKLNDGEAFAALRRDLARLTHELQATVLQARMAPLQRLFIRLPRVVRDTATACGKEVVLRTSGEETELDRNALEALAAPLVQLVRNAIAHGIEPPGERRALGKPSAGTVEVRATVRDGEVVVSVRDDGRGVDLAAVRQRVVEGRLLSAEAAGSLSDEEALRYVFVPGLSTAAAVTGLSGRGTGMDVVRTSVERLGGAIEVRSERGVGTQFVIRLPVTVAPVRCLVVEAGGSAFAVPLGNVADVLPGQGCLRQVAAGAFVHYRGLMIPVSELPGVAAPRAGAGGGPREVVIVREGKHCAALLVEAVRGEATLVARCSRGGAPLVGATVLDDGRVAHVISVETLLRQEAEAA